MTEIENTGKIPEDDNTGINKGKLVTLMKAKDVHQIGGSLCSSESKDLSFINSLPLASDRQKLHGSTRDYCYINKCVCIPLTTNLAFFQTEERSTNLEYIKRRQKKKKKKMG